MQSDCRGAAGDVLITGGLGALGTLVAVWIAAGQGGGGSSSGRSAIRLLGRSGRPDRRALQPGTPLHRLVTAGSGGRRDPPAMLVTMARCDAASAEEASAATTHSEQPLATFLHAAGILQVGSSEAVAANAGKQGRNDNDIPCATWPRNADEGLLCVFV